ncbi:MAG: UDP-N-acetylmuramate dehydrogenase [Clostridia bacterium]|nr:UDP-N-acetylmuramate dehydrogenase [Clostridia bacterium]
MRRIDNAPMSKYTSFRAGGTARLLVIPETVEELSSALREAASSGAPWLLLGNGSNTLFLDGEFPGTVIMPELGGTIEVLDSGVIKASADALLSRLARAAAANSLTGLEFAGGIPGSVGGGVFMNAGAYGGELKDCIVSADVLMPPEFELKTLGREELGLGYRHSALQENGAVVVSAAFALEKGDRAEIDAKMADLAARRSEKQPLEYPSAGSFFKRPPGQFAGKLIQDAGLKGLRVGGAQVSEKHSGFIINAGNATATDIVDLMHAVQDRVLELYGVLLEPEVRLIGPDYGKKD